MYEDLGVIVVNKPGSVPVHPCGRYRHNTVVGILGREHQKTDLHPCHRLDRLTSGILILAKTKKATNMIEKQIRDHTVQKEYICRVRGTFPATQIVCEAPIKVMNYKLGVCSVDADGKECKTTFTLVRHVPEVGHSIVKCLPETGRMHQIRVHLQHLGFPIANDPIYNLNVDVDGVTTGVAEEWTVDRAVTRLTQTLEARDAAIATPEDNSGGIDWRQCVWCSVASCVFYSARKQCVRQDQPSYGNDAFRATIPAHCTMLLLGVCRGI